MVQNNTDEPVRAVSVTATAWVAAGGLVAAGREYEFAPDALAPGDYTIGFVWFDGLKVPTGAAFVFTSSAEAVIEQTLGPLDLVVEDVAYRDGVIAGTISNPHDEEAAGPIWVLALCLSETGDPVGMGQGTTEGDSIPGPPPKPAQREPHTPVIDVELNVPGLIIAVPPPLPRGVAIPLVCHPPD